MLAHTCHWRTCMGQHQPKLNNFAVAHFNSTAADSKPMKFTLIFCMPKERITPWQNLFRLAEYDLVIKNDIVNVDLILPILLADSANHTCIAFQGKVFFIRVHWALAVFWCGQGVAHKPQRWYPCDFIHNTFGNNSWIVKILVPSSSSDRRQNHISNTMLRVNVFKWEPWHFNAFNSHHSNRNSHLLHTLWATQNSHREYNLNGSNVWIQHSNHSR